MLADILLMTNNKRANFPGLSLPSEVKESSYSLQIFLSLLKQMHFLVFVPDNLIFQDIPWLI